MSISTRLRTIFVEVEATPGTAETLVAADAIEVSNLQPNPVENIRLIERDLIKDTMGPRKALYAGSLFGFSFDVELAGSGAAGTPPQALGDLLRACALSETIVASTSVTYAPTSDLDNHDSVTIGLREGPNYRIIDGCRGSVSFNIGAGQIPMLTFTMVGHIDSETQTAAPTPTFPGIIPPPFLSAAFSVGGFSCAIESLTMDLANTLSISPNPNAADGYAAVRVTDNNITGTINPEQEAIGTKDWIGILRASTNQAIQTGTIGSTAGNRWALNIGQAYFRNSGFGDREALLTNELEFGAAESAGDDQFSLVLT